MFLFPDDLQRLTACFSSSVTPPHQHSFSSPPFAPLPPSAPTPPSVSVATHPPLRPSTMSLPSSSPPCSAPPFLHLVSPLPPSTPPLPPPASSLSPLAPLPPTPCCPCAALLPRLLSSHRMEVRRLLRGALASLGRRLNSLERRSRRTQRKKKNSQKQKEEGASCLTGESFLRVTVSSLRFPAGSGRSRKVSGVLIRFLQVPVSSSSSLRFHAGSGRALGDHANSLRFPAGS